MTTRSIVKSAQAVGAHEAFDAMLAAGFASLPQIKEDSRRPVDALACDERGTNQSK
jgi:hypothetical protein